MAAVWLGWPVDPQPTIAAVPITAMVIHSELKRYRRIVHMAPVVRRPWLPPCNGVCDWDGAGRQLAVTVLQPTVRHRATFCPAERDDLRIV